jgi:hypothetical protein
MTAGPSEAGPPAAAAAQAPGKERASLSPAELAARGEAPVRAEYLRGAVSRVHVGVVTGQMGGAAGGQETELGPRQGAAAVVAAAGDGERQRDVRAKSKKQAKKVGSPGWRMLGRAAPLLCVKRPLPLALMTPNPRRARWHAPCACRSARSSATAPQSCARCLRLANAASLTRAGEGCVGVWL